MNISCTVIESIVRAALLEDLGHGRDITTQATIRNDRQIKSILRARDSGVLAGLDVALRAFTLTNQFFDIKALAKDGDIIEAGQDIAIITGSAISTLIAERTALNFLIHMSGIASLTNKYVLEVQGTNAKICDTRKTLANLRSLQKYAVLMGGGHNHRFGLDDAILIKDNHIAIAGGVEFALKYARDRACHAMKVEIEVDNLKQLEEVLKIGGADIVMLDNFNITDLKTAIKIVDGKLITEASGGVNLNTVLEIAKTGVNYISVGALTHSAPAIDIGLDIFPIAHN